MRHQEILGLRPVDGVPEAPAPDRFAAVTMAALRVLSRKAGATLSAGRDGADQHAIADRVSGHPGAELRHDADRLVADHQAGPYGVLAAEDVQVGAADRRQGHSDDRLADAGAWALDLVDADVVHAMEYRCSHRAHRREPPNRVGRRSRRAREDPRRGSRSGVGGASSGPRAGAPVRMPKSRRRAGVARHGGTVVAAGSATSFAGAGIDRRGFPSPRVSGGGGQRPGASVGGQASEGVACPMGSLRSRPRGRGTLSANFR